MILPACCQLVSIKPYASITEGWYARSEGFLQQDFSETLRWVRTFGDVVFIIGGVSIALQVVKLVFGQSPKHPKHDTPITDQPSCDVQSIRSYQQKSLKSLGVFYGLWLIAVS